MTCQGVPGSKGNIALDAPNWMIPVTGGYTFGDSQPFNSSNADGTAVGTVTFSGAFTDHGQGTLRIDAVAANNGTNYNCTTGAVTWTAS